MTDGYRVHTLRAGREASQENLLSLSIYSLGHPSSCHCTVLRSSASQTIARGVTVIRRETVTEVACRSRTEAETLRERELFVLRRAD